MKKLILMIIAVVTLIAPSTSNSKDYAPLIKYCVLEAKIFRNIAIARDRGQSRRYIERKIYLQATKNNIDGANLLYYFVWATIIYNRKDLTPTQIMIQSYRSCIKAGT